MTCSVTKTVGLQRGGSYGGPCSSHGVILHRQIHKHLALCPIYRSERGCHVCMLAMENDSKSESDDRIKKDSVMDIPQGQRDENNSGSAGKTSSSSFSSFGDPVETIEWGGTLPNARRALIGTLAGASIALGGNLGGITSFLLGLDGGELASKLRLDVIIPVKGYKRCVDYENRYEFLYPASWLADQSLYRKNALRIERENALDPPPISSTRNTRPRRQTSGPTVGFGPPGSSGEDNVSVVVAPVQKMYRLEDMGTPKEVAQQVLENTVAPPTSNKIARLIDAQKRRDAGTTYYTMEFVVERPGTFSRHNVAVYGVLNGYLYTLNAQSKESSWNPERAGLYRKIAETFRIF